MSPSLWISLPQHHCLNHQWQMPHSQQTASGTAGSGHIQLPVSSDGTEGGAAALQANFTLSSSITQHVRCSVSSPSLLGSKTISTVISFHQDHSKLNSVQEQLPIPHCHVIRSLLSYGFKSWQWHTQTKVTTHMVSILCRELKVPVVPMPTWYSWFNPGCFAESLVPWAPAAKRAVGKNMNVWYVEAPMWSPDITEVSHNTFKDGKGVEVLSHLLAKVPAQ